MSSVPFGSMPMLDRAASGNDWSTRFCVDQDLARRSRRKFFEQHADTGRLIFPTHFPTPTGGTLARDGQGYRFVFDGERT